MLHWCGVSRGERTRTSHWSKRTYKHRSDNLESSSNFLLSITSVESTNATSQQSPVGQQNRFCGIVLDLNQYSSGKRTVVTERSAYESCRRLINREKFLRVEGVLQNQDNVISIKASRVMPISI